ncbi:MAG: hypothetical protein P857_366 [Candidatus Xenolissoclinum pacificiensis L6]|uniref:Flagellar hook-associated protein 2 C-terminal domain-containing protein n=1 Tax=Candidatus Xenolissoclinum pacificiensis L6 TaxID=1401685 RepID=W2UZ76_9RICK|nr:MAG: hypothetical protein P857_366 [Candidatus Xenolissoclinum pacificiensis L6]
MQGIGNSSNNDLRFTAISDDPFEIVSQNQDYLEHKLSSSYTQVQFNRLTEQLNNDQNVLSHYYSLQFHLQNLRDVIIGRNNILDSVVSKNIVVSQPDVLSVEIISRDLPIVNLMVSNIQMYEPAKIAFEVDLNSVEEGNKLLIINRDIVRENIIPEEFPGYDNGDFNVENQHIEFISSKYSTLQVSSFFYDDERDRNTTVLNGKYAHVQVINGNILEITDIDDNVTYIGLKSTLPDKNIIQALNELFAGNTIEIELTEGMHNSSLVKEIKSYNLDAYNIMEDRFIIKSHQNIVLITNNEGLLQNVLCSFSQPAMLTMDGFMLQSEIENEFRLFGNSVLLKVFAHYNDDVYLKVEYDYNKIINSIESFVLAHNDYIQFVQTQDERDYKGYLKEKSLLGDDPEYHFIKSRIEDLIVHEDVLLNIGISLNSKGFLTFDKNFAKNQFDSISLYRAFLNISDGIESVICGVLKNRIFSMEEDVKISQSSIKNCHERLQSERGMLQKQVSHETTKMIQLNQTISLLDMYLDFMTADK